MIRGNDFILNPDKLQEEFQLVEVSDWIDFSTKEVYIYENPIFIHSKEKEDLTDTSKRKNFDEMSAHKQYKSLKRKQKAENRQNVTLEELYAEWNHELLNYLRCIIEPYSLAIQLFFYLFIRVGETKK